jgi:hypothetical protein
MTIYDAPNAKHQLQQVGVYNSWTIKIENRDIVLHVIKNSAKKRTQHGKEKTIL